MDQGFRLVSTPIRAPHVAEYSAQQQQGEHCYTYGQRAVLSQKAFSSMTHVDTRIPLREALGGDARRLHSKYLMNQAGSRTDMTSTCTANAARNA